MDVVSVEMEEEDYWVRESEYRSWDILVFGNRIGQSVLEKTEADALEAAKVKFAEAVGLMMKAERVINNLWLNSED